MEKVKTYACSVLILLGSTLLHKQANGEGGNNDNPFGNKVKGSVNGKSVTVSYTVAEGTNFTHAILERAGENTEFREIGTMKLTGGQLTFEDNKPITGFNYYRIRFKTEGGKVVYNEAAGIPWEAKPMAMVDTESKPNEWRILGYNITGTAPVKIEIATGFGKILATRSYKTLNGELNIGLNPGILDVGTYIIKVLGGGIAHNEELVVCR